MAADPARGIPAFVKFPNLASFREQLERMLGEYERDRGGNGNDRRENQKRLAVGLQLDDAAEARINEGFRKLKALLGN